MEIGLVLSYETEEIEQDINEKLVNQSNQEIPIIKTLNTTDSNTNNHTMELATFQIHLNNIMYGYILFIICIIGIFGNLLVIFVLTRKALRSSTTGITLRVMAMADTLVCVTAFFRYKTYKLFMSNAEDISSVFHTDAYIEAYVEPLFWIALGSSSLSTLLLSLERYLAVCYPFAVKKMCSAGIVCIFIAACIATVIILTIPMFLSYGITIINFQEQTVAVAVLTKFGKDHNYPCAFNHYVIPFVWYIHPWIVLTIVNILLTRHVRKSSRIRVGIPNVVNPNRNLSVLVILVVLVYMVCNFPMCSIALYKLFTTTSSQCLYETREITNPGLSKPYVIGSAVANVLVVLNSCLNIFIYCFVGSKFRKELKLIILCESCKKNNTVNITNTFHITLPRHTGDSSCSRS